jgi:predicted nucleic-acid-binding protein
MRGLDTNVLLAWLLEGQARALPEGSRYRVGLVVLAELAWVLRSVMRRPRAEIAAALEMLAQSSDLVIERRPVFEMAVADFRAGPADFADYLIARDDEAAGCETTLTLDRKAARHPLFTLLDR